MQESLLYERWKSMALLSNSVRCGPDTLRVIDAGQLNLNAGPDFRSARFRLNGITYQGDVECHCRSKDWYQHQHHLDRSYANVLLHIVPQENGPAEHVLHQHTKRQIRTIAIPPLRSQSLTDACLHSQISATTLQEFGLKRFHFKMHEIASLRSVYSPEQVFYELFMKSLGYTANAVTFQMLARRLPWSWLKAQLAQNISFKDLLAIYAGIAGFLNPASTDSFIKELLRRFRIQRSDLDGACIHPESWVFAAVRPFNHPHFRIAGWVSLLETEKNPLAALRRVLEPRLPASTVVRLLQHFFQIPCSPYWQKHYGFGLGSKGRNARFFFGPARIIEIIQNLLLPFFAVEAQESGSEGFLSYLESIYCQIPVQSNYLSLEKRFPFYFQKQKHKPSLALCQGLLYLKQYFCDSGKCAVCPINLK